MRKKIQRILENAVAAGENAGSNLLVLRDGDEWIYAEAGMADIGSGHKIRRDSIFRLYSMTKPVTSAAVMKLMEMGKIDLLDPVEKWLPAFKNQQVCTKDGTAAALRSVNLRDLLSMTAGLCYPGEDAAGQAAARVFEENQRAIDRGEGMCTRDFVSALGQCPLAFQPGEHFRYSTCADVLGAVVEAVSGHRFSDFLKSFFFDPLGMRDTDFYVRPEAEARFVTCYQRTPAGLVPWTGRHLCCGEYGMPPAFESGGAGLVSTLDDYARFATMLLNGGVFKGKRILEEGTVRFMTSNQLMPGPLSEMWDSLWGFGYGKLMRVCMDPGRYCGLASRGEYGWDGWLGTYFANLPEERMTILYMENTVDTGTSSTVRKVRNVLLAK